MGCCGLREVGFHAPLMCGNGAGGPGLGMGWAPLSNKTFKVTEFEKMRCDARMPREQFHRQGRISPEQRHRMLMAC